MSFTRREFLGGAAAVSACLASRSVWASPLGLPLGIQLYSVRQQMAQDLDGTLMAVGAAGFVEVEAAALPAKPAAEVRAALDKARLRCVSAHHSLADLRDRLDQVVAYDKTLGVSYIICPSPGRRNPVPKGARGEPLTLDDWRYSAGQFNAIGEKLKAQRIMFGYHNHISEFAVQDGMTPYTELLRLCEPGKVAFELDCGWAKVAGVDPIDLMRRYPHRFSMLHLKDFDLPAAPALEKRSEAKVTELGRGSIDYRPIFAEAKKTQKITHAFVEQEAFDMPWKDSLKIDANYLKALDA